jgi:hypothetical protein
MPEQDLQAAETHHAEEVLNVVFPADHQPTKVVKPSEKSFYSPTMDTGLRPDECYRLRWEDITWGNGRNGTLLVTHGKTAAARRVLPMTVRVRSILETRWAGAGKPREGWIWPAPTNQ